MRTAKRESFCPRMLSIRRTLEITVSDARVLVLESPFHHPALLDSIPETCGQCAFRTRGSVSI